MEQRWAYWIHEVGEDDAELVGKKCANLGEMNKIKLPVPQGFCLTIEAHEAFLAETGALTEIQRFLATLGNDIHSISGYEKASKGLRSIVESKEIPKHIEDPILAFYESICHKDGREVGVAVRSAGAQVIQDSMRRI